MHGFTDSTDFTRVTTSAGTWETMQFQYYRTSSFNWGSLTRAAEGLVSHSVSAAGSPGDSCAL